MLRNEHLAASKNNVDINEPVIKFVEEELFENKTMRKAFEIIFCTKWDDAHLNSKQVFAFGYAAGLKEVRGTGIRFFGKDI